jgi:hypothetical protein
MSGWPPSRPPWETQDQPRLPADGTWYGAQQGPRVVIKPHGRPGRGGRHSDHYAGPPSEGSRGQALAGVIVGLAAAVGLAAGAHQLTYVTWGETATSAALTTQGEATTPAPPATTAPATTAPATPSSSPGGTAGTPSYVLAAPATAGGYTLTSAPSATIKAVGSAGASQLMTQVEAAGGKATGSVTGEYLISSSQSLGYAGYNGTFSPATVISLFKMGATGVTTESAGPHGGELACGDVTANSATGTACLWVTPTTLGMVEFFGGTALEHVLPAKAGADALKFRDDVESAKGTATTSPSATTTP